MNFCAILAPNLAPESRVCSSFCFGGNFCVYLEKEDEGEESSWNRNMIPMFSKLSAKYPA